MNLEMAQYQSFPGAPGASNSVEKLQKLAIPSLRGKRFLDIGCNEGFFCGYAVFDGATEVIGLDQSHEFIERARSRFPGADFRCQGWEKLPDGTFDVILMASALHYADDQSAMVRQLLSHLAPDGTLVLEIGVASGEACEWVRVRRGIDERDFPTMSMVTELLAGFAWKHMGTSVTQSGDPVRRHVFHVHHRKPVVYLLLQPPGSGKSTLARELFSRAGVHVVSGDATIAAAVRGKVAAPPALLEALSEDFSAVQIDRAIERVVARGLGSGLVAMYFDQVDSAEDFALDAYVPQVLRDEVERLASLRGYLPIALQWQAPVRTTGPSSRGRAERFFDEVAGGGLREERSFDARGHVDEVRWSDGILWLRGWAFDSRGRKPATIEIEIAGERCTILDWAIEPRSDVCKSFGTPTRDVGFVLTAPCSVGLYQEVHNVVVRVSGGDGGVVQLSLSRQIRNKKIGGSNEL